MKNSQRHRYQNASLLSALVEDFFWCADLIDMYMCYSRTRIFVRRFNMAGKHGVGTFPSLCPPSPSGWETEIFPLVKQKNHSQRNGDADDCGLVVSLPIFLPSSREMTLAQLHMVNIHFRMEKGYSHFIPLFQISFAANCSAAGSMEYRGWANPHCLSEYISLFCPGFANMCGKS